VNPDSAPSRSINGVHQVAPASVVIASAWNSFVSVVLPSSSSTTRLGSNGSTATSRGTTVPTLASISVVIHVSPASSERKSNGCASARFCAVMYTTSGFEAADSIPVMVTPAGATKIGP
jgi:hypothetical protein